MIHLSFITIYIKSLTLVLLAHPIHVTVTEIEFDQSDKRLEIMMRVFMDDFELALREHLGQPELDVMDPAKGLRKEMADSYLKQHFRVLLDNRLQKFEYLGHETESDAFIFYIEVPNIRKFKTITIHNDILTGIHEDQSNLVHVTVNGKTRSLRLTRTTPSDKISFETEK
ncbi:MAG TPA: DUF6702 family protein [Chryseosolibacter sp.]|nr:DUF6702 family protein [Chryseosolibacter sp.]